MKTTKASDRMTAARKAPRRRASPILAAVHESISGLHSIGAVSLETMREFDALCLSPVVELAPIAVRQPSASAPFIRQPVRGTPEERIRRALELGRRGQLLRKLNPNARSKQDTGPR